MRGFEKILKMKIWNTYSNARKIADDIIISMIKNHDLYDSDLSYMPTYISTVQVSNLLSATRITSEDDDEYNLWCIRVYQCNGNRKSKLSISQNPELMSIVNKIDKPESFTNALMTTYKMNGLLNTLANKYRRSKNISSDTELTNQRIELKKKINNLIYYVENLYTTYPDQMKSNEAEVNNILKNVADTMNMIELDESMHTVD